jgi:hypothetical protein
MSAEGVHLEMYWQSKSANFVIGRDSMVELVCKREGGMERSLAFSPLSL